MKRKRRHELWILSCYINLDLVEEFANRLLETIRLTDIYFAFNSSEIYRIGSGIEQNKLTSITYNLNKQEINFEWRALLSPGLMHAKGYALIQTTGAYRQISDGVALITSANFTNPGFRGMRIESGYRSIRISDIRHFTRIYDYLWDKFGKTGKTLEEIFPADEKPIIEAEIVPRQITLGQSGYMIKFGLLSSGIFLHKWDGNLKQQIGIRYESTMQEDLPSELINAGFEREKKRDTLTRQVLKLGDIQETMVPSLFIRRFTIETYLGRWCPSDAWDTLNNALPYEGARRFIHNFENMTGDNKLEEIMKEASYTQRYLIDRRFLQPVGLDHLERWRNKIRRLRDSHRRLERFYNGYDAHELPYQYEQESDIQELFDNIEEAIELSGAMNIAKRKFDAAKQNADPRLICLSEEEKQIIRDMVEPHEPED